MRSHAQNGMRSVGYVSITAVSVLPRSSRLMMSAIGMKSSGCGTRYVAATPMATTAAPGNFRRASGYAIIVPRTSEIAVVTTATSRVLYVHVRKFVSVSRSYVVLEGGLVDDQRHDLRAVELAVRLDRRDQHPVEREQHHHQAHQRAAGRAAGSAPPSRRPPTITRAGGRASAPRSPARARAAW